MPAFGAYEERSHRSGMAGRGGRMGNEFGALRRLGVRHRADARTPAGEERTTIERETEEPL